MDYPTERASGGRMSLEEDLNNFPDKVASALEGWRIATLDREKREALLYAQFKGEDKERTATEIRSLIHSSEERYQAVLLEIKSEAEYTRLYEKLMGIKKIAQMKIAI